MSKSKITVILLSLIFVMLIVPASFSAENQTDIADNGTLMANDYYFDVNVENDTGNGSPDSPYKEFTSERIVSNSILHLSNGQYNLDARPYGENVTIIGQDSQKTIVNAKNFNYDFSSSLTLKNITFVKLSISTSGNLTADNVMFKDSARGVITSTGSDSHISLNNCSFENNYADNGATVKMTGGYLSIDNSVFLNNYAQSNGGAIYASGAEANITSSRFINNYALNDAGGAIYIYDSPKFRCQNVTFDKSHSFFGGAIASVSSNLTLTGITAKNNFATYFGGFIFVIYNTFTIESSLLDNNSAESGGALYVDGVDVFNIRSNVFSKNTASKMGGAVYSVLSDCYYDSVFDKNLNNTFKSNAAPYQKDVYSADTLNLTIGDSDYIMLKYKPEYNGKLPSRYDLRTKGYVTSVKSQDNGGNCWSFSALAALESAVLKASGLTFDFSEENMKNLMALYSDYGWSMSTNNGGYDKMAVGYLTSWLGPVNDTDDVYNGKSILSPVLHSFIHVQNILYLTRDNYTDNDAIKKAIMDYGAVSTSIYWSSSYAKGANYYYSGSTGANHAVAIVGWDDNYSKNSFKETPEGNGAWIIKNSWGTGSGEKGYYYVSYYDTRFAQPGRYVTYAFVFNDTIRFDKNYQYDIAGKTDYFINSTDTVWYKNRFTATDNEYLAAVSTHFEQDSNWELSVYVNGALKLTQSGFSNPGYSTVTLDRVIPLKQGNVFEIVFKIAVESEASVPISEAVSLNVEIYGENISYISYDGKNWKDLYNLTWTYPEHTYASQVACIKAFTVLEKLKTNIVVDVLSPYNPSDIRATVYTQDGAVVKSGAVTFNIEGKNYKVNIKDGSADISYLFKNYVNNNVKVSFAQDGYVSSSQSVNVTVTQINLMADDLTVFYSPDIAYSVKVVDKSNSAVAGKEVRFKVNGVESFVVSDSNGVAVLHQSLKVGNYEVSIGFNDINGEAFKILTKHIYVKSTVDMPSETKYTFNSTYGATLYDSNGVLLKNRQVTVKISNGKSFNISTNSKGVLKYNIELDSGSYSITVVNPASSESKTQSVKVVKRITQNSDLTMYYGAGSCYKVKVCDDNGNAASNVKVTFTINGKNYTRVSDSNGIASFKVTQQAKTYTITASYKGFAVSNKITVKPTLVLKDKTVKKSKTFKYTVKLLNSKGKIVKNKKVTVKFRGKTYNVKTNSKGIATFNIKAFSKTGKFTLTASYGSAKISKNIIVKK